MRLGGGSAMISWCSFRSNSASIRGPAITVMDYYYNVFLEGLWFEDNGLYCPAGFFLEDVHQVKGCPVLRNPPNLKRGYATVDVAYSHGLRASRRGNSLRRLSARCLPHSTVSSAYGCSLCIQQPI